MSLSPFMPRRLTLPLLVVAALAAGCIWAYWPTLQHLVGRWWRDPQASHGFIVPVLASLVLWSRKRTFPDRLQPALWGVCVVSAAAFLRLFAAYLYLDWFDGVSLVLTLVGVVVLVGGAPLLGWSWPALVVLVFLLPLPYGLEITLGAPLQQLATLAGTYALQTFGYPAISEGNVILIDDYRIGVMDACNGLGMLVAFFALSTTVALIIQRSLTDRLVIFFSAIPVGVLMNLLRIAATGVAFPLFGRRAADVLFHDLAGWLMMPLALAVLWVELRFLKHLFVTREYRGPLPLAYARQTPPPIDRTAPPVTAHLPS
jgi:exosortase